ncbi:agmatine deiminase family protein [Candidatus Sumerlaeota bacterium]|nr:agmatine deiminase family protein [Candidatus Sumerlaeota bacterium]
MPITKTTLTPRQHGFAMPAEWTPHQGTILAYPHNKNDWPGKFQPIKWVFADIVRHLSQVETVYVLCGSHKEADVMTAACRKAGANLDKVSPLIIPTDRIWTRDSGPIFVSKNKPNGSTETAFVDWQFNAWAKYDNYHSDREVPQLFNRAMHHRWYTWKPVNDNGKRVILEGGSIDVNGQGILMTTCECLLDKKTQPRNPSMDQAQIESVLADYLGVTDFLWLEKGIVGDDTHGHIDDTARFVNADTIVCAFTENTQDENHAILTANEQTLKQFRTHSGKSLDIVRLPMPSTPLYFDKVRLPASYANFYIANGIVLVPTFNDPNDRIALGIIAELFPQRKVIGIHALDLVWGFGTLHCMSQQIPEGSPWQPQD